MLFCFTLQGSGTIVTQLKKSYSLTDLTDGAETTGSEMATTPISHRITDVTEEYDEGAGRRLSEDTPYYYHQQEAAESSQPPSGVRYRRKQSPRSPRMEEPS